MYDLVVIGSGPGGYSAAVEAAKAGLKTAVIEAGAIGGTCLNRGCIPTKYLITQMHGYENVQKNISRGLFDGSITLNYQSIIKELSEKIGSLVESIKWLIRSSGVDIITGHAEFADKTHIKISEDGRIIEAANIIIATGSSPRTMKVSSSYSGAEKHCFTTDNIFSELSHIPETLTIVGAGAVGLELAFIFAGFGSKVTVLEKRDTIFGNVDNDIDTEVMKMLRKKGIDILLGADIDSIFESADGVVVFDENEDEIASGEAIVFALGRIPNINGLKLENAGVNVSGGRITVDANMRTSAENIFAVGDVNGIKPLAYTAFAQSENTVALLTGHDNFKDLSVVPMCIFTDTETAYVGLTECEAKQSGIAVSSSKFLMTANGRSSVDENGGFIKIIADKDTDVILGGACVCHNASELIGYITVAVSSKMTVQQFASVIFPHPTYSESLSEAAGLVKNMCIHML